MRREDDLLEQAKRLSVSERRRLAERLLQDVVAEEGANGEDSSDGAIDEFLKLNGIGHSDYTDVSSDKYKHLGALRASK